jgi:hypothetical protein
MQTTFLDKLAARLTGRREKAVAGFDGLVRAVADDKPPSAEQAEAVLGDSGRTADDLAEAVQRLQKRRLASAALKRGQTAVRELEAVETKAGALNAAHVAAVEKLDAEHGATLGVLRTRARELERDVAAMQQAESFLRETGESDAGLAQRLKEQLVEAKRLRDLPLGRANKAGAKSRDVRTPLASKQGSNWNNPALDSQQWRDRQRALADALDVEEESARREAAPHVDRVREIEGQLAALDEATLQP